MIAFKHSTLQKYLLTNYKVMFSTLDHQPSLEPVGKLYFVGATIAKRIIFSKLGCSLVVRNPYDRIISFYKDKFLRAEEYRLWMQDQGMDQGWQRSTQIFFPYLGLSNTQNPKEVSKRLSQVSFEKFVQILPKVYLQDGHLTPQYLMGCFSFRLLGVRLNLRLPLHIENIYQLESSKDLQALASEFQLDLNARINTTEKVDESISWSSSTLHIVEQLYARDFELFGYERRLK